MARNKKLVFDKSSFSVREEKRTFRQKFLIFLGYLSVAIVFFVGAMYISFRFFDSPTEKKLRRDLQQSELQYKQLQKRVSELSLVLEDIQQRDDNLYRLIFEAEPPNRRSIAFNNYENFKKNELSDLITKTSLQLDNLSNAMYAQSKSFDKVYMMAKNKNEMLQCMPAILPVNKTEARLSSGFGMRHHPIARVLRMHTGIDFAGPKGTAIYATGDGTVRLAGLRSDYSGYGNIIEISHGFGYVTLYAHLSKLAVRSGQKVKRGEVIGYMGSTGTSTSSHLHYEVFSKGTRVNPVYYFFNDLSPEEYSEIFEKSKEINQSLS